MPAYQAEKTVGAVVRGLAPIVERVVVVDDGSTDRTGAEAAAAGAEVLRLPENGGKGTALRAGLARILAGDATHVAFVDADAQHDPADLPRMLEAAREGDAFVIGSRMADLEAIPSTGFAPTRSAARSSRGWRGTTSRTRSPAIASSRRTSCASST